MTPGGTRASRKQQGLTPEGFETLLSQLAADRGQAGEIYEAIRHKLIRLFEWRGCAAPEDLADETINRVARRLAEGVELRSNDPYGYFCGVAHLVFKEVLRHAAREQRALGSGEWPPPAAEEDPSDRRLDCLRACLSGLPPDQRDLVLRYYQGSHPPEGTGEPGEGTIRRRQELAREEGIPMNALRIRIHRIRRKLEPCIQACLGR